VPLFHSHVQIITRGKGKSAVAAAAYRAGETIKNEYDGMVHDYTRKRGIVYTEIMLPQYAPAEYKDRAVLWNAVERIEKADNSQLARELDIALPIELTREQNISLARDYVKQTFVDKGMCADLCVHDTGKGNPHIHIMLTMRPFAENGKWGNKQKKEYILDHDGNKIYDPIKRQYKCRSVASTDWNNRTKADEWRAAWEDMANAALKRYGFDGRIDRRSYEEQGIEKIPTVHMGVAATQMERQGIRTERGDINREIEVTNNQIKQLRARISKLEKWIAEEATNTKPPTLADVITDILSRQGQSSLTRLKSASQMLMFLQENQINDMAGLEDKVKTMRGKVNRLREDLKKVERRIGTLDEHLRQSENFTKHRKIKARYESLYSEYKAADKETGIFAKHKAQKALDVANEYHHTHSPELAMFDTAEQYLRGVLQKRFDPKKPLPIDKWQEERAGKTAERAALNREYETLKAETQKVEQIKRSVGDILKVESSERTQQRIRSVEL